MKKKLLCKCFITLGFLLFFTIMMPLVNSSPVSAMAADTGKNKNKEILLNVKSVPIVKGKTFQLYTYNVGDSAKTSYKSSDDGIASVNNDGLISASKVGDAVITVTVKDGSDSTSLSCDVTVTPAAVSVKWTEPVVVVGVKDDYMLNYFLKPTGTAEDPKFTSSDDSIVYVSSGGRATGKNTGLAVVRAYIEATDSDGTQKNDLCGVIVVSNENVSKVKDYFEQHTELDKIPNEDLIRALSVFFNSEYNSSSPLISSLDHYLTKTFNLE